MDLYIFHRVHFDFIFLNIYYMPDTNIGIWSTSEIKTNNELYPHGSYIPVFNNKYNK